MALIGSCYKLERTDMTAVEMSVLEKSNLRDKAGNKHTQTAIGEAIHCDTF